MAEDQLYVEGAVVAFGVDALRHFSSLSKKFFEENLQQIVLLPFINVN